MDEKTSEERGERVTLAVEGQTFEVGFSEGYRTAIFDLAAVLLAGMTLYAFISWSRS